MKHLNLIVILAISFTILACTSSTTESSSSDDSQATERTGQAFIEDENATPNCLQIAIGSSDHSTLVAAVQAAQVENALVNVGPLTVFAPTNAAFDALPEGTVENLLKPENKAALADILKYHVTPGNLKADFLTKFKKIGQANNQNLEVKIVDGKAVIGGANIIASIPASNGIVHVIDAVLLPPTKE
ncbi:fasciclin domain-containing protein [Arcticibacterium luteifluviistationis]|uniref:Fasciclin n=1 Tax=Arcticibacterium luteifluviistationis TaxID=1784714 RepID=A0A2Z4GFG3_9BACT|nr:fasciclin domain-containing protein [Arcticibacterium luteifluviistationis]AWW00047.1 fasciclin [Arcticibacterium luteifluviistationis]